VNRNSAVPVATEILVTLPRDVRAARVRVPPRESGEKKDVRSERSRDRQDLFEPTRMRATCTLPRRHAGKVGRLL
jgi:hypothetical protein